MSSKYGKNFTGFQNVSLQGSPTSAPVKQGMIEMGAGITNAPTTISVDMIPGSIDGSLNGSVEQPYFHIQGAGLSIGTGFLRMTNVGSSPYGTLRIRSGTYLDADMAWQFPAKSGTFPIMGTFNVQFPTITSTSNVFSTVVTVSGIRAEDALVVQLNRGITAGYDVMAVGSGVTARILNAVTPGNGQITMGFLNNGLTTAYADLIYSYLAMR